tara:strand:+ start:1010 stop:1891 length:882 start_codon:yes stop_codon:yes gene_type:complete
MMENETHEKIINILKEKGPSLPIQIAKQLGISSLFISAYLSELAGEKRIKISHLKVGGSPLYFIEEQAEQLEKFYKYLHPKEAEAFLLLKKKKILKDDEQKPPIRVALRSIRDFAIGFKKDDEIFWRYFSIPESEINDYLKPKKQKVVKEVKKPQVKEPTTKQTQITKKPKKSSDFENPLVIKEKPKKQKAKSEFIQKTIEILSSKFVILEEKNYKAKEYNCILQIKSELGPINFLVQAKDKKKISETDLKKLLSEAQKIPLSALFIHTGELSKKAKEFAQEYYSILKIKKIK